MEEQRIREFAAAIRMSIARAPLQSGRSLVPAVTMVDPDRTRALLAKDPRDAATLARSLGLTVFAGLPPASQPDDVARVISTTSLDAPVRGYIPVDTTTVFAFGRDRVDVESMFGALLSGAPATAAASRDGRLAGRVVAVTGSAQGFGRGIAEELAAEGAAIVVADINDPVGTAFAGELTTRFGAGSAIYRHLDVSDAASIESLVDAVVREYGGLDIFISNAGVLKAGSLEELDEKGFDLVTAVNYKAFFLCTRAVSRIMKIQHRYFPRHVMDIIQINSKSGLEGSNKNFAYAGSKFGGIGLTQSFALELVEYNIKVNAICPGNYYEGPLWSDPDKGLFVQYLRTGKVPGAKTIADVRNSYMSKVPMKRGCSPRDVARAIFYLHEQEYETGQALPVTGGQVMLN